MWPKEFAGNLESKTQELKLETLPEPQHSKKKKVLKFVGIVIGVLIFLVVVGIICCCCLPCCFLAKRRNERGTVHGPAV
jgi:MFS superfamily sulfate permease-like transporter